MKYINKNDNKKSTFYTNRKKRNSQISSMIILRILPGFSFPFFLVRDLVKFQVLCVFKSCKFDDLKLCTFGLSRGRSISQFVHFSIGIPQFGNLKRSTSHF